jgi:uncharacterized membrane protein HdeD (DUF308 family)
MDSKLHDYKGWVFSLGFVFLVAGIIVFLSPLIPGVEKVVHGSYLRRLIFSGGFSLLGTGVSIIALTEPGPHPKSLAWLGIFVGSTGTLMILYSTLNHFGILP